MYTGKTFDLPLMWPFAKKNIIRTSILSFVVTSLYFFLDLKFLAIPFLPIGTIGTAVAFYVGFKNNQAYERLWEARRLWGGFTNTSRNLTASVTAYIEDKEIRKDILYRHLIYLNIVRLQLRKTIPWASGLEKIHQDPVAANEELLEYDQAIVKLFERFDKMDIYVQVKNKTNLASHALSYQYKVITKLKHEKKIDEFEHSDLLKLLGEFYNLQGGCERIKNTPLFRQYSVFSRIFVNLFIFLVPFGLLSIMDNSNKDYFWVVWLTVPFSLLISWVFYTMEKIGEFSENPFDNGINDTPMSAICRSIEIDVLELMGEKDLPEKMQPHNNILL